MTETVDDVLAAAWKHEVAKRDRLLRAATTLLTDALAKVPPEGDANYALTCHAAAWAIVAAEIVGEPVDVGGLPDFSAGHVARTVEALRIIVNARI